MSQAPTTFLFPRLSDSQVCQVQAKILFLDLQIHPRIQPSFEQKSLLGYQTALSFEMLSTFALDTEILNFTVRFLCVGTKLTLKDRGRLSPYFSMAVHRSSDIDQ